MKKAMVVLAVLAMAVSGCDTGLQDKIDDLENKNKELEQKLAASEELVKKITVEKDEAVAKKTQLAGQITGINAKLDALKIALAADDAAKIASAKTALKNAGYDDTEADGLLTNAGTLTREIERLTTAKETAESDLEEKDQQIATLNTRITALEGQVPIGQDLQALKALEWAQSSDRRLDGQPLTDGDRSSLRTNLLNRIYNNGDSFEAAKTWLINALDPQTLTKATVNKKSYMAVANRKDAQGCLAQNFEAV